MRSGSMQEKKCPSKAFSALVANFLDDGICGSKTGVESFLLVTVIERLVFKPFRVSSERLDIQHLRLPSPGGQTLQQTNHP